VAVVYCSTVIRGGAADGLYQVVGPGKHTTVLIVTRHVAQVLHQERGRSLGPQHGRKRCEVDGFVTHRNAQRLRHFLGDRVVVQFLGTVQRIDLEIVWFGVGQGGRDPFLQPRRAVVEGMHEGPDAKPAPAQQCYGRDSGLAGRAGDQKQLSLVGHR
jgi:hypothetical protein